MRYAMHADDRPDGRLFEVEEFRQRLVSLEGERHQGEDDEVLYVLEGRGSVSFDGESHDVGPGTATAGRSFFLGPTPDMGCRSVTQFVGLIPPGRAPDHFHEYDEVIYVLEGEGELVIGGEQAPLRPGSCIHLPRTLVHCLANTKDGEMRVLGVFRPAGSPAEAYYPDGTPAAVPKGHD